ncbi:hypothetical protein K682_0657 [Campylobacter jejuni HB-CJGB-ZX]|nr:hypothetical protein K682_0657 [Campylobacter jejuni HB-CJGB-ZX]
MEVISKKNLFLFFLDRFFVLVYAYHKYMIIQKASLYNQV